MSNKIQQIVEKQLVTWRRECSSASPVRETGQQPMAVTISYAARSHGAAIATGVAKRLEVPHHDRAVVVHIATSAHVHMETVESLDAHVQGRIDEYISSLFRERNFDRGDYLRQLGRTVVALWQHGPCVLSGHGVVHFVRDHSLAVRLTAPTEVRAARLAAEEGLDMEQARKELLRADAEQEAFHRRFFNVRVDDVKHYDLGIDTSKMGDDDAAALVVRAFQQRVRQLAAQRGGASGVIAA
jgi:cytidylate kinase